MVVGVYCTEHVNLQCTHFVDVFRKLCTEKKNLQEGSRFFRDMVKPAIFVTKNSDL